MRSGNMSHCGTSTFDIISITFSFFSKTYNIALESEFFDWVDVISACLNDVGVLY